MANAMSKDPLFMSQGSRTQYNTENGRAKTVVNNVTVLPSEDEENERVDTEIYRGQFTSLQVEFPGDSVYPGSDIYPNRVREEVA